MELLEAMVHHFRPGLRCSPHLLLFLTTFCVSGPGLGGVNTNGMSFGLGQGGKRGETHDGLRILFLNIFIF